MKQKKKPLFFTRIAALSLLAAIGIFCIIFILIGFFESADDDKEFDLRTHYEYLAEIRSDFAGSFIQEVPIEEVDLLAAYVDYYPENIADAFDLLYGTEEAVATFTYVTGSGSAPHGPADWAVFGEIIVERIEKDYSDFYQTDLYDVLSEPFIWIESADVIIPIVSSNVSDTGSPPDLDFLTEVVVEVIIQTAAEEGFDAELSFVKETVIEYFEEQFGDFSADDWVEYETQHFDEVWDEYRDEPIPSNIPDIPDSLIPQYGADDSNGLIEAKHYPINYRAIGPQMYRGLLNAKQKIAYDVIATAIQSGLFHLDVDFGIDINEFGDVTEAIMRDFQEFFYIGSYGTIPDSDFMIKGVSFGLFKGIQGIGVDAALARVATVVNPVVAEAKKMNTQIDQVKFIVDYMCDNIKYAKFDNDERDGNVAGDAMTETGKRISELQNLWSAVIDKATVCAGYSSLFQHYMSLLGIHSARVGSGAHAWNLLELDGDYYYMDVTWIDNDSGEPLSYMFFNFNKAYIDTELRDADGSRVPHDPVNLAARLPVPNGTKYGYENWFGPIPGFEYLFNRPVAASATVIINGADVSSRLTVSEYEGVLYADAKSFAEAFADRGVSGSARWFDYEYNENNMEIRLTSRADSEKWFGLSASSRQVIPYFNGKRGESIYMNEPAWVLSGKVNFPILAFAEALGKAGYEVEIILNGKTYSYKPETVASNPTDQSPEVSFEPDDEQDGDEQNDRNESDDEEWSDPPLDSWQHWDIPEWWESDELIEDWQEGPTSLWVPMEATEVVGGITGTYVGYYKYTPNQIVVVFNDDNTTGYDEEMDSGWPACRFEFSIIFDTAHPMFDNTYNGMVFTKCVEDGHNDYHEFVVVSPTVLYEPQYEAIFYKVE